MAELQAQGQAEREALEKRDKEQEQERRERYQREYPEALRAQKALFDELKEMGIIEMLEEMTYPDKIAPIYTYTAEEVATMHKSTVELIEDLRKEIVPEGEAERSNLPPNPHHWPSAEEFKKAFDEMARQEWRGFMIQPQQNSDGSIDPTLHIYINNDTPRIHSNPHLGRLNKTVKLSYARISHAPPSHPPSSSWRVLKIEGGMTTFQRAVTKDDFDKEAIENALAYAFLHPQVEQPPMQPPVHLEPRIG